MKKHLFLLIGTVCILGAATSRAADVRQGLVSYWPLNTVDWATYTTPDVVASNDMSVVNMFDPAALVAGKFGQALAFDAAQSQYAAFVAPTNLDLGLPISRNPSFTVSLWVKALGTNKADSRYFCEASVTNADNNPLFAFGSQQYGTNASTRTYIRNPATVLVDRQTVGTTVDKPTLDGTWHHIGLVYDRASTNRFWFYVDGQLDFTTTYVQGASIYDSISIGGIRRAAAGSFLSCTIDDLAVWVRALSQAEIQDVMSNSIATPIPNFPPGFSSAPLSASNLAPGDSWTFAPTAYGTRPITFQWTKNGANIAGATSATYYIPSLTTADAGNYAVVAANANGSATSAVATLSFITYPAANLTNGIISYWPLDTVLGTKTPDLVSGYDMTLVNMTAANLTPGKWGQAFSFDNAKQSILQRIDAWVGEDLPIYNKPNFTVSLWVQGWRQTDHRVFAEGSTTNTNPLFDIGTHNGGTDGSVDSYIRNNSGAVILDHQHSTGIAFDGDPNILYQGTWHHIAYVQRDIGGGLMKGQTFIDGALDPMTNAPTRPLTANTTAIGGLLRGSASAWFTGSIDEVAVWSRALSAAEIQMLLVTAITNAPIRPQPLAIKLFTADFAAVAKGDSIPLRWEVSRDATQVTIDQGVGDVTAKTSYGTGTNLVTLNNATKFVLNVKRGAETLSATTSVAVVDGIAPGWTLLDNFDLYSSGNLAGTGYWVDPLGASARVVDYNGNKVIKTVTTGSIVLLPLQSVTLKEGQNGTLFFRMIVTNAPTAASTNLVGLTDKSQRSYADDYANIGPLVYPSVVTNDVFAGITTNAWYLGARNGLAAPVDFTANPLETGVVYNVWIDITNAPMGDPYYMADTFSVYIQKDGDATRTPVFQSYVSDRDLFTVDAVLGGPLPNLDKLVVIGNNATLSPLYDDFYISKSGYNTTVPRAYGFTGATVDAKLQIRWSGSQVELVWTNGKLQEAPAVTGPFADVSGAAPPSYKVTPSAAQKFYRLRQ